MEIYLNIMLKNSHRGKIIYIYNINNNRLLYPKQNNNINNINITNTINDPFTPFRN